jgi:hypothetical protein
MAEPGSPDWLLDALDTDVRLRVTSTDSGRDIFVGIGPEVDVDTYLAGVAHDEIAEIDDGAEPIYRSRSGDLDVAPPTGETFWTASASGPGTQELSWEAESGQWAVAVMNADGSPVVAADVNVGAKAGLVLPLALTLLGLGAVVVAGAVVLVVIAASGERAARREEGPPATVGVGAPPPIVAPTEPAPPATPVRLSAYVDPALSPWQWLVKWFLAIPHAVVLIFLWIAFGVLTVVAGFSILFTGTYPRRLFDFNVGVLRWTWRVAYYAATGGIGTDQYPPFSLDDDPSYPARLDIAYPERLSRGLVLVKWWLLAIPHYLIIGILAGGTGWVAIDGDGSTVYRSDEMSLLGILVLIAGVILLFTGRYPARLFDLIVGINRWVYRVVAYAALMTDQYPPFRLDQGGAEPSPAAPEPGPAGPPASEAVVGPEPAPVEEPDADREPVSDGAPA